MGRSSSITVTSATPVLYPIAGSVHRLAGMSAFVRRTVTVGLWLLVTTAAVASVGTTVRTAVRSVDGPAAAVRPPAPDRPPASVVARSVRVSEGRPASTAQAGRNGTVTGAADST